MAKRSFYPYAPRPEGWKAPLTRAKAEAVAADRNGTIREVGERHGVSRQTVYRLRNENHWLFYGPETELVANGIRPQSAGRSRKRG
jgi:hypothetical protein